MKHDITIRYLYVVVETNLYFVKWGVRLVDNSNHTNYLVSNSGISGTYKYHSNEIHPGALLTEHPDKTNLVRSFPNRSYRELKPGFSAHIANRYAGHS